MNRLALTLIVILAAGISPARLGAQAEQDRFKRDLEPIIESVMAQQNIPGLAVAVVKDGKVVYARGFGVKSLKDRGEKVTERSLFHMASVTKPFVATAVMELAEQGKLDIDSPVVKYLPHFRMKDERYRSITVRQMLGHASGMPDVEDYEWEKTQYDEGALERYVRSLGGKSLIADPGTLFRYSNMAFEVLGDLVAKVSGKSFEDYVEAHILKPLGMKDSTLLVKKADPKLLTTPHVMGESFEVSVSKVFPYNRMHGPSSTLYSNVLDMSRWAIANMNRGELDGKRILKASTYDVMWKLGDVPGARAGLSWFIGKRQSVEDPAKEYMTIYHSGRDTGFVSQLTMIPDRSVAVVMMINYDQAAIGALAQAALDVALGLKPQPIKIKPAVSAVFYKTLTSRGLEAAVAEYYDLKKSRRDDYNFAEQELNGLGYALMGQNKIKEAIRVFQLNVEAYPSSSNVYDSLGEAYMTAGDKEQAIKNYEKSLELDPKNTNAVEMLKKLRAK
jgi:CubicO group peptidase (beta-lactamase class C family)